MKQVTTTGATVDVAVEAALKELETTKDRVEVNVVDEGKKGLFGVFGSKPAIVKVTLVHDPVEEAEVFLKNVTEKMGVDVRIETSRIGNDLLFDLSGEKIALLIGKRGQTLNSLQYLTHLVTNRYSDEYLSVVVDAEGYRNRRKETLESLAGKLANKALRTRRQVVLEPMPSYERKIIHTALFDNNKVKTHSEGNEPHRHVVIVPVQTNTQASR